MGGGRKKNTKNICWWVTLNEHIIGWVKDTLNMAAIPLNWVQISCAHHAHGPGCEHINTDVSIPWSVHTACAHLLCTPNPGGHWVGPFKQVSSIMDSLQANFLLLLHNLKMSKIPNRILYTESIHRIPWWYKFRLLYIENWLYHLFDQFYIYEIPVAS